MVDSVNTVIITIYFILPGYVMRAIISRRFFISESHIASSTIQCLTASLIADIVLLPVFSLVTDFDKYIFSKQMMYLTVIFCVFPAIAAFLFLLLLKLNFIKRAMEKLSILPSTFMSSVWGAFLDTLSEKRRFIIVIRKTGEPVVAYFGDGVLWSGDNKDIYLTNICEYREDENGSYEIIGRCESIEGIFIPAEEILEIRVFTSNAE